MEYTVELLDEYKNKKVYDINVNCVSGHYKEEKGMSNDKNRNNKMEGKDSDEQNRRLECALETVRIEYEHSFRRAERLDNKVYIMLTIYGFIFVVFISCINKLSDISCEPKNWCALTWVYIFMLASAGIEILGLLLIFIMCLSSKNYVRIDSLILLEKNMLVGENTSTLIRYIIIEYELAKYKNNELINKQFKLLNVAVVLVVIATVTHIVLMAIGNYIHIG